MRRIERTHATYPRSKLETLFSIELWLRRYTKYNKQHIAAEQYYNEIIL